MWTHAGCGANPEILGAGGKDGWVAEDGTLYLRMRMVGDTSANSERAERH